MMGNRFVVLGLVVLCSVLAGCIGAPFTADAVSQADTDVGDGGSIDPSLDPLIGDAGSPAVADTGARGDAGASTAQADAGAGWAADASPVTLSDAGQRVDDGGGSPDAGAADAGACDGGPLYLHHVGLLGLTWQDCVPTGTYDAAQALAACAVYAAATGAVAHAQGLALCNLGPLDDPVTGNAVLNTAPDVEWTYDAADYCPNECTTGHVAVAGQSVGEDGGPSEQVTSAYDPSWD